MEKNLLLRLEEMSEQIICNQLEAFWLYLVQNTKERHHIGELLKITEDYKSIKVKIKLKNSKILWSIKFVLCST